MIPAPMSMYTQCVWLHTCAWVVGFAHRALSWLRWYMCGQCTVYLSVGGTVELNRFLLPDSREIKKELFFVPTHFFRSFVHLLFHHTNTTEKEGKNILYTRKISFSHIILTGSREEEKENWKKKIFILCRVLFSLHVAPMCIVCDAVSSRVFFSL